MINKIAIIVNNAILRQWLWSLQAWILHCFCSECSSQL